jgi:hypothetical protein
LTVYGPETMWAKQLDAGRSNRGIRDRGRLWLYYFGEKIENTCLVNKERMHECQQPVN